MKNSHQLHVKGTTGIVVKINVHLLGATALAVIAYFVWPNQPQWWGLGLITLCFGVAAITQLIQAFKLALQLYRRDKAVAAYLEQGAQPKTSQVVSGDDLEKAGMR